MTIQYEAGPPSGNDPEIVTAATRCHEMQKRIAAAIREKTQGGCEARVMRVADSLYRELRWVETA